MIIDELTWYDELSSEREFICRGIAGSGGDYRTGCSAGERSSRGCRVYRTNVRGGVSEVVEVFRTTFVFGINSYEHCSSTGQFIGPAVRMGTVRRSVR